MASRADATLTERSGDAERLVVGRLLWLAPLAAVVSIVINLIVRAVARGLFDDISDDFRPFSVQAIVFWTVVGTIAAAVVFALVARTARHPIERYRIVALVALVLSLIPDVALLIAKPDNVPGITGSAIAGLMVMHVVVAAVCVVLFTTLTREA